MLGFTPWFQKLVIPACRQAGWQDGSYHFLIRGSVLQALHSSVVATCRGLTSTALGRLFLFF